jgi:hypothetical protein
MREVCTSLSLSILRGLASAAETVFLALLDPGVSGKQAVLAQLGYIELIQGIDNCQGLSYCLSVFLASKSLLKGNSVDDNRSVARH